MPVDLTTRARSALNPDGQLMALLSLLPWSVCLLLAHAYPTIAAAYALVGRLG